MPKIRKKLIFVVRNIIISMRLAKRAMCGQHSLLLWVGIRFSLHVTIKYQQLFSLRFYSTYLDLLFPKYMNHSVQNLDIFFLN